MSRLNLGSIAARHGTTLAELLVVITITSFVLVTVAVLLQTMYQTDRAIRDELEYFSNVSRLSIQLRADAHAARSASLPSASDTEAKGVSFELQNDQVVTYIAKPGFINRTLEQDGQILHRDTYRLAEGHLATWSIIKDNGSSTLAVDLVGTDPNNSARPATKLALIQSIIGLDQHHKHEEDR